MGLRFLKIAVVYLVLGALLGLAMGLTQSFTLAPVHAHILLLGWASLALAGLVYHLYPAASTTRLAQIHFWLHNIGLPLLTGSDGAGPLTGGAATIVLIGLILFALNVLLNAKAAPAT